MLICQSINFTWTASYIRVTLTHRISSKMATEHVVRAGGVDLGEVGDKDVDRVNNGVKVKAI